MKVDNRTRVPVRPDNSARHPLDVFFAPRSVAVFGATEKFGDAGRSLTHKMVLNPFGGVVFPISPHRSSVLGVKAYSSLARVPGPVDLAIVITPAATVPDILVECQDANVKAAIIVSTGFGDSGPRGKELDSKVQQVVRRGSMRVLGMGSFGVACPRRCFHANCASDVLLQGTVGFLTQSGALLTALLDESHCEHLGCSIAVSTGSLIDIGWTEWLDYLAQEAETRCIGIYMERLDDARSFFASAREIVPHKPIVLIKSGSDTTDNCVFDEACRSNGVLRVHRFADLFRLASYLTSRPAPRGRRLAILSNARGPAALAADAIRSEGSSLAPLSEETVTELAGVLTPRWDRQNPIDIGGDSSAELFTRAAAVATRDSNTDALLLVLAPQTSIDPEVTAQGVRELIGSTTKPILACWMYEAASQASLAVLRTAGIPTFRSPESAVRTFGYLWRHSENLRYLSESREALTEIEDRGIPRHHCAEVVREVGGTDRTVLTFGEVEALFSAFGLPIQRRNPTSDPVRAVETADVIGYPVLVELDRGEIAEGIAVQNGQRHDVGEALRLKAVDANGVRRAVRSLRLIAAEHFGMTAIPDIVVTSLVPAEAVELAASTTAHREIGPMIALGAPRRRGATPDHAVHALAPLTPLTAREMIENGLSKVGITAAGSRADELEALEEFLLRLSRLAIKQREIRTVTIGSLLLWDRRAMASEVRVTLWDSCAE
jgi:acetyltransferase